MDGNDAQVRLVFSGEVLDGFQRDEVKRRFGEAFKVDGTRLDEMFSGERTVLKRSIGRGDAERYVMKLRKMGLRVRSEPLDAAAPATDPKPTLAGTPAQPAAPAIPALVPLEEEVTCPNCGERQPKRVICRKCQSDIPRALAAKQEELDKARAERLAARGITPSGGRFAPPNADVEGVYSEEEDEPPPLLGRSFDGRMGRVTYFNAYAANMGVLALLGIVAAVLIPSMRGAAVLFVPFLLVIPLAIFWGLRAAVLRLHDMNLSGWWVLFTFVPVAGGLFSLAMAFWPGTKGENDYGAKPRRGNLMLAIIVTVIFVIGIFASLSSYRSYVRKAKVHEREASTEQAVDPLAAQKAERYLSSALAQKVYLEEYLPAANDKVFAASDSGAWGWRSSTVSLRDAARAALAACEERRKPYTTACTVVNVNGQWVQEQTAR